MKKRIITIFIFIIILISIGRYNSISICIKNTCILFFNKIFPAMFFMFIISSILIDLNIIKYFSILFNKFNKKLFNINLNTSYILLISILTGCPNNAKSAKELYENKYITKLNIQKILLFSHFMNPFFIISNIKFKTYLILIAHYISNIIIGIIFKNKYNDNELIINNTDNKKLNTILFESIDKAINTSLFVLGTIITFSIISSTLNIKFLNIILEISSGMNYLINMNISLKIKTILCGMLLSFGGLCIHMQIYGIISNINIKYLPYLLSRIFQAIITGLIIFIFY